MTMGNARRARLRRWMLACGLATAGMMPAATPAQTAETAHSYGFAIPAGPLAAALVQYSDTTGIDIVFDGTLPSGLRSPGVSGTLAADEALRRLLAGTGLTWRFNGPRAVRLDLGASGAAVPLPAVTVEGERQTATGPVDGYLATRSSTAAKTDTPIRDIAQSIEVVTRKVIDDQQDQRLVDVTRNVSGIQPGSTNGNRMDGMVVRGFQTVASYTDGLQSRSYLGDGLINDLANVDRVEVLKGPAAALYGQGDPGGIINMITKRPTATPLYAGSATLGSFGFRRVEADLGGALDAGNSLLFRATGAWQQGGSFRDFFVDGWRGFVAPTLTWQGAATRLTLSLQYNDQKQQYDRGIVAVGNRVAAVPMSRYLGERYSTYAAQQLRVGLQLDHDFDDTWSGSIVLRAMDGQGLRYSADPRGLLADNRTLTRRLNAQTDDFNQYLAQAELVGHELRTGPVSHTLLFGLQGVRNKRTIALRQGTLGSIDIFNPVYGTQPGPVLPLQTNYDNVGYVAGYIQDQIALGQRWKMQIGARVDHVGMDFKSATPARTLSTVDLTETAFSPRAGLVYEPAPWLSLYASYVQSFRPQPDAGNTFNGQPLQPETSKQYEAGIKTEFLDGRLASTLAVYQLTRRNVATPDPVNAGFTITTGEQRSRGVEFDVSGRILPGWDIIASAAFTDAEVTADNTIPAGNRLAGVPRWSGSLWSTYEFTETPLRGLGLGAGLIAVGRREGDLANTFEAPGYLRVDASVSYRLTENVDAALNVKNLFNVRYVEAPVNRTEIYPGAPFTVLGRLSARF